MCILFLLYLVSFNFQNEMYPLFNPAWSDASAAYGVQLSFLLLV